MVNYGNSKIYKIEPRAEHEPNEIYIGSTTKQYLSQRMDTHRSDYKRYKVGKSNFITSFKLFDKYGLENCDILLLENVNATNKDELRTREAYYIRNLECVNKKIECRTHKEYCNDNKDKIKDKKKEYYNNNKDKIKDKKKEYYNDNKDKKKEYYNDNKDKKKEYYNDNKDKIKEYKKEYYNNNKDKIKKYKKEYYNAKKQKLNETQDLLQIEKEFESIIKFK
jgi:hypothetical protein